MKNPHDVRFMRSAQKLRHTINQAYRRHVANIRVHQLARQSGISKSAFYDHYHSTNDAISHIEREIIRDFRRHLHRFAPLQSDQKSLFTSLLLFIQHNYEDFDAAIERQNYGLIVHLLSELHPLVARQWPRYQPITYQQLFYLYAGEATFVIIDWVKQTKCRSGLGPCAARLTTIVSTAPRRFRELPAARYADSTPIPEITRLLTRMDKATQRNNPRGDHHPAPPQ